MPSDPQRLGAPFSAENVTLFSLLWVTGGKGPAEGPSPGQGDAGHRRALEALGRTPHFSADNLGSHGRALMFSLTKILVLAQT